MTSDDLPLVTTEKPSVVESSDVTASTLSMEYEDDTIPDSELEEDDTTISTSLVANDSAATLASKPVRQVCFDKVHVREYNVILGVHPLASGGYPLELGWEYNECTTYSVDAYEQQSCSQSKLRKLSPLDRHFLLAQMCGGNLMKINEEEDLRLQALARERREEAASLHRADGAEDETNNIDEELSEYTKQQMLRCTSYKCLSEFV